jgi:cobalt/nickel transport system permease protein
LANFHVLDAAATENSWLSRFDARLKSIIVVVAIMVNLLSNNVLAPLLLAALSLGSLAASKISWRRIGLRMTLPFLMAGVVFLTQIFINGSIVIGHVAILGFNLSIYHEGLVRGLLIVARVIGGTSLVVWLSL